MTFTQYLRHLVALGIRPSFRFLFEVGPWPEGSVCLEDYQAVVHNHLDTGRKEALLELRTLWDRWTRGPASNADLDADHALLAWRDYALHLRDCTWDGAHLCPRAEQLLGRALRESHFHQLASLPSDPVPCEETDASVPAPTCH